MFSYLMKYSVTIHICCLAFQKQHFHCDQKTACSPLSITLRSYVLLLYTKFFTQLCSQLLRRHYQTDLPNLPQLSTTLHFKVMTEQDKGKSKKSDLYLHVQHCLLWPGTHKRPSKTWREEEEGAVLVLLHTGLDDLTQQLQGCQPIKKTNSETESIAPEWDSPEAFIILWENGCLRGLSTFGKYAFCSI